MPCSRCGSTRPCHQLIDERGSAPWCSLCLVRVLTCAEQGSIQLTVMVSRPAPVSA